MKSRKKIDPICQKCGLCSGTICGELRKEISHEYEYPITFPTSYKGIRFTSDAMDCALPIAIDSHSGCSYNCLYCFSNNLQRAPDRNPAVLQRTIKEGSFYSEWNINKLEKFLDRDLTDKLSLSMYKVLDSGVPVQLGALGDPFDNLELHSGWAKKAIPLFIKYKIPVRVGTKGGVVLQRSEYLKLFEKSPDQFWFAFSIISNSDDLISKIDVHAPVTSERLKAMRKLTQMGCNVSLRFRPFLPGVSDSYPGEPEAWKTLIERSADAGARAISFEYIFLNPVPTDRQKIMYQLMFQSMGNPKFAEEWHKNSKGSEICRRANRDVKYKMTKNIKDLCHVLNMSFGCSDPHFKEWNDSGCCCGMPDSGDKWFSNWSRKQMTEVLFQARKSFDSNKQRLFNYEDWKPEWAHEVKLHTMIASGNWHNCRRKKYVTFGDHMRQKWNNPKHPRGPYMYFDGVLIPAGIDRNTGDLAYKYKPWNENSNREFIGELNEII